MPDPDLPAQGRVLIIAGSDSGGGAGIQADIKTVTALGGYAMTAVTAITVQNTLGVSDVHAVPSRIVDEQIRVVMEDIYADAVKVGMLGIVDVVAGVAQSLDEFALDVPVIVDPVMVAKGGSSLLAPDAVSAVKELMLPRAALVTPNAPEAERLTGIDVRDVDSQKRAAEKLLQLGAQGALVKGGHIDGDVIRDVLLTQSGLRVFEGPRIHTSATHGTGCTLASAIAAYVAQGIDIETAVQRARAYLVEAIRHAPGFGQGHGPLGHNWTLKRSP